MTKILQISGALLLSLVSLLFFDASIEARESKQQRKENALAIRTVLTYLPRISDSYRANRPDDVKGAYQKVEASLNRIKDKFQGQQQKQLLLNFSDLGQSLERKASVSDVLDAETKLYEQMVRLFAIEDAPAQIPDFLLGQDVYRARCAGCHGVDGKPATALAKRLHPMPSDLSKEPLLSSLTPFRVYNVLITGIEGTSKVPLDNQLTDHELWSVAFYTLTLRCLPNTTRIVPKAFSSLTLQQWSTLRNEQLKAIDKSIDDQDICRLRATRVSEKGVDRK